MSLTVTGLVLIAALLHAAWNAIVKTSADRLVSMAWLAVFTSMFSIPFVWVFGLPDGDVIVFLVISLTIHTAYMLLLARAYSHGDFGQVYPLARGVAPVLVTLYGVLLLGEVLIPVELIAIGLIVAGVVSLSFKELIEDLPKSPAVAYALATGLAIACYTIVDGMGGRAAVSPIAYTVWLFSLHGFPITLITLHRRGARAMLVDRAVLVRIAGGALMSVIAYGIVIWAMANAPLGPVSALRETSVVFAALISALVLKEKGGPLVVLSAVLVVTGVIVLRV